MRLWLTAVLDYVAGGNPGANPILGVHLYQNDVSPGYDTGLADFQECTFPGYAPKFIGGQFPAPVVNPDQMAQSDGPIITFTPTDQTSNEEVHGWFMTFQTDAVPALLFAAERIVPAVHVNQLGAKVRLQIKLTLGTRFAG